MDRVDDLAVLIKEITKDHPLTETEVSALAVYADIHGYSDAVHAYRDYYAVCDWLECTSRISPKERKDLLALVEGPLKRINDKLSLSTSYGKFKRSDEHESPVEP